MCLCLRKRGNAAHFQLINTADRACWRKPHYAAGWWVAWVGSGGVCAELLSRFSVPVLMPPPVLRLVMMLGYLYSTRQMVGFPRVGDE